MQADARGLGLVRALAGGFYARTLGELALGIGERLLVGLLVGVEAAEAAFEVEAFALDLAFESEQLLVEAAAEVGFLVEALAFGAERLVAVVARFDLGAAGEQRVGVGDADGEVGGLGLGAGGGGGVARLALAGGDGGGLHGVERGELVGGGGLALAHGDGALGGVGEAGFGGGVLAAPRRLVFENACEAVELGLRAFEARLGREAAFGGAAGEAVVAVEREDLGEDVLALAGALFGELVGAALEQKRGVHERVIVQPHAAVDLGLRLADRRRRERLVAAALRVHRLQFQPRLARLPRRRLLVRPHHAVALRLHLELELDLHPPRADAQQVVVGLAAAGRFARLAPERPRDGVQQRAFALPVAPRQARHVELAEVERLGGGAVGQEVFQTKKNGNHAGRRKKEKQKEATTPASSTVETPRRGVSAPPSHPIRHEKDHPGSAGASGASVPSSCASSASRSRRRTVSSASAPSSSAQSRRSGHAF